jgi:DNA-3-methyladenine glycosylase II
MGLTTEQLTEAMDVLAAREPAFAVALERIGYPPPRISERGFGTLLRTIIGQQVSVTSAQATYRKLEGIVGSLDDPANIIAATDEQLRAAGLSRQKASYARSLSTLVTSGELDLANLPEDDEEAIAKLVAVKGIGRWSAEIYLLFAEGRTDIWRCRSKSGGCSVMKRDRARSWCASWRKPGAPIAARRRSLPGIIIKAI